MYPSGLLDIDFSVEIKLLYGVFSIQLKPEINIVF